MPLWGFLGVTHVSHCHLSLRKGLRHVIWLLHADIRLKWWLRTSGTAGTHLSWAADFSHALSLQVWEWSWTVFRQDGLLTPTLWAPECWVLCVAVNRTGLHGDYRKTQIAGLLNLRVFVYPRPLFPFKGSRTSEIVVSLIICRASGHFFVVVN